MHDRSFTVSPYLLLSPLIWFSVSEVVMLITACGPPAPSPPPISATFTGMVTNIVTGTPVSERHAFNYLGIASDI